MPDFADAVAYLKAADPKLAAVIDRVGPYTLKRRPMPNLFHALCQSIAYQQLSGKAAATIFGRVQALAGKILLADKIKAIDDAALRACGLSRAKLAAFRDLSDKVLGGVLPDKRALIKLGDEEVIERLTVVRGIGRWSAEMILMFRLGRPDVLPVTDYGVRKGFTIMLGKRKLAEPEQISARGKRWAPWRSIASWYLWRVLELPKS
ncbi:MAG: DNA-3-methyladenine glycosylase 2 family protein [Planctomycetes bacterium]|nr:DNA-3-methyladenine glycosylase 2 family protein [Planctomycetota bacterium]